MIQRFNDLDLDSHSVLPIQLLFMSFSGYIFTHALFSAVHSDSGFWSVFWLCLVASIIYYSLRSILSYTSFSTVLHFVETFLKVRDYLCTDSSHENIYRVMRNHFFAIFL